MYTLYNTWFNFGASGHFEFQLNFDDYDDLYYTSKLATAVSLTLSLTLRDFFMSAISRISDTISNVFANLQGETVTKWGS